MQVKDKHFVPFIGREKIAERIAELGEIISEDYAGKEPLVIGILNGSFMFTADLARAITTPIELTFVKFSSYAGTQSTGKIQQLIGFQDDVRGRHVVLVEDIVDTGRTMRKLLEEINAHEPLSVKMVTLLLKPEALETKIEPDYVGFSIGNRFVVGYGLDYDGYGRELPEIYVLKEEAAEPEALNP